MAPACFSPAASNLVVVGGDLDSIVGKCLEKEPAGRYQTAEELANELRPFLNGEPIISA